MADSAGLNPLYSTSDTKFAFILPSRPEKQSACNCRTAIIVIIALAAIVVLVVGILGMKDVISMGEVGAKVAIGLSASILGGLLLSNIINCYRERKHAQYQTM